jgi:glycosyltransferase involved in cell wall biosynthesis
MGSGGSGVSLEGMRVLQVIPVLAFAGLERIATMLTIGLSTRTAHVTTCTSGAVDEAPFEDAIRAAGVPVEHIPRPRPRPWPLLTSAVALARVLRSRQPHLVHAHNPAAGAAAALARALAGHRDVAIVTTYHGVLPRRMGRATRALSLSSDFVVGCGPTATSQLRALGLSADHSATVFNAVEAVPSRSRAEVRRELGADDAELVVNVGRHVPEKNQALLLDAVALLADRRPGLRAVLVGGGPLSAELRDRARQRGLEDRITLAGARSDVIDIVAAADVFALSSATEALPLAVLEAMALGRPVVATAVGGVGDAVQHEQTGLLVPPGAPRAFAAAVERLLDDKALSRRLGTHAREFAANHCSLETMIDSYSAIYVEAVARRRSRFNANHRSAPRHGHRASGSAGRSGDDSG